MDSLQCHYCWSNTLFNQFSINHTFLNQLLVTITTLESWIHLLIWISWDRKRRVVWCVRKGQGICEDSHLIWRGCPSGGGNKHCTQVIGDPGGVCCWNSLAWLVSITTLLAHGRLDHHRKWQARVLLLASGNSDTFFHINTKSQSISQRVEEQNYLNSELESVFEHSLCVIVVLCWCVLPPLMQSFWIE